MKITKTRLKQIIKEEFENVVEARQPRHKIKASDVKRARNILKYAGHGFALNDEGELQADEKSVKLLTLDGIGVQSVEEKLNEELTRQDKTDVKKMVKDELEKLLKKKEMKDQISELTKKILKKLYRDLSLEHPYIIDRIKI